MMDDRLRFTDHALVRLVERHIDPKAMKALRRQGLDEGQMAYHVREAFAQSVARIIDGASQAYERRSAQCRNVLNGLAYIMHLGHVPLLIRGGVCVTVLPHR